MRWYECTIGRDPASVCQRQHNWTICYSATTPNPRLRAYRHRLSHPLSSSLTLRSLSTHWPSHTAVISWSDSRNHSHLPFACFSLWVVITIFFLCSFCLWASCSAVSVPACTFAKSTTKTCTKISTLPAVSDWPTHFVVDTLLFDTSPGMLENVRAQTSCPPQVRSLGCLASFSSLKLPLARQPQLFVVQPTSCSLCWSLGL